MTNTPKIIMCSGIVFITTPFPHGSVNNLLPPVGTFKGDVGVDLRASDSNEYFVVMFNLFSKYDHLDEIMRGLQYIWHQMIELGVVSGSMPTPVEGNPLDMLPQ
jgi:hypothetical protein